MNRSNRRVTVRNRIANLLSACVTPAADTSMSTEDHLPLPATTTTTVDSSATPASPTILPEETEADLPPPPPVDVLQVSDRSTSAQLSRNTSVAVTASHSVHSEDLTAISEISTRDTAHVTISLPESKEACVQTSSSSKDWKDFFFIAQRYFTIFL